MMFKFAAISLLAAVAEAAATNHVRVGGGAGASARRSLAPQECINFETNFLENKPFSAGDLVTTLSAGDDVTISVSVKNPRFPAMIFDSSNPTGGDPDLGTPNICYGGPGINEENPPEFCNDSNTVAQGNVLIISEDRDQSDPDDKFNGGTLFFEFSREVTFDSISILDVDKEEGAKFTVIDSDGVDTFLEAADVEDNGFEKIEFDPPVPGVRTLEVEMTGSGAIPEICYTPRESLGGCETAFARCPKVDDVDPAMCFIPDFQRWGWTNLYSGDSMRCTIYAGAGQCDEEKGTVVGYVDISSDSVDITLDDDVRSGDVHFWAGTGGAKYPQFKGKDTVAPGQYKKSTAGSVSSGNYFILHLEVCPA